MTSAFKILAVVVIGVIGFYSCGVGLDGEISRQDSTYEFNINNHEEGHNGR